MAENTIKLPIDLPGYEEAKQKIDEIIKAIKEIEAKQTDLAKNEQKLAQAYDAGNSTWGERKKEVRAYYKELLALENQLKRLKRAEKAWAEYLVKLPNISKDQLEKLEKTTTGAGISYPSRVGRPAAAVDELGLAANVGFSNYIFNGGLEEAFNETTNAKKKFKQQTDSNILSVGREARTFKWTLGFILMGVNALNKLTSESKVFQSLWGLIGRAFGFILDMIILPLAPFLIWIAKAMFMIGGFIHDINSAASDANPVLGALLGIFELLVVPTIFLGIIALAASILGIEGAAASAILGLEALGIALATLGTIFVFAVAIEIMDEMGITDWIAKQIWIVEMFLGWAMDAFASWARNILGALWDGTLVFLENWARALDASPFSGVYKALNMDMGKAADYLKRIRESDNFGRGGSGATGGRGATQTMEYNTSAWWRGMGLPDDYTPLSPQEFWELTDKRWREMHPKNVEFYDSLGNLHLTPSAGGGYQDNSKTMIVHNMTVTVDYDKLEKVFDDAWDKNMARYERQTGRSTI